MTHSFDIILASNRPRLLREFLRHHKPPLPFMRRATIYVVVDDEECKEICEAYGAVPIANPRPDLGYYGLNFGYQEALEKSRGDFVTILNDEVRYPRGWWRFLQWEFDRHLALCPDHMFRLRVSEFRHNTYENFRDCMRKPENYAIATREWMEVTGGVGEFWGPDSWHQCIEFCVAKIGLTAGFPVDGFFIKGTAAGVDYIVRSKRNLIAARIKRKRLIEAGWAKYSSEEYHAIYQRIAERVGRYVQHYTQMRHGG